MTPTAKEQKIAEIVRQQVPRLEILRISVPSAEQELFAAEIFGLDGRENEPLVLRDALSVEECGIIARAAQAIIERKLRDVGNAVWEAALEHAAKVAVEYGHDEHGGKCLNGEDVSDGFGSTWPPCHRCGNTLQVMRPGDARCMECENEQFICREIAAALRREAHTK